MIQILDMIVCFP